MRRYEEANGADPVLYQVKKVCIISNTREPLKKRLQLKVGKPRTFDGLRVATEDYLRSRRIFKTTSNANTHTMMIRWKSTPRTGKRTLVNEIFGKGKKGGKKGNNSHTGKVYGEQAAMFRPTIHVKTGSNG